MRKYPVSIIYTILFLFNAFFILGDSGPEDSAIREYFPSLSDADIAKLISEGEITNYFYTGEKPLYFPDVSPETAGSMLKEMENLEISIGVESLYYFPCGNCNNSSEELLKIYNTLWQIQSLKGIEYYSATRGRMRTLFKEAYIIEDLESAKTPLPDPVFQDIPLEKSCYIFQEDLTFGKNISEARYRHFPEGLSMSLKNSTIMRYALVPFIKEGNMHTHVILIPEDGFILFYGYIGVETISFFGIERKNKESFYYRMKALYNWFRKNYSIGGK